MSDSNPMVVANAVAALSEINESSPTGKNDILALISTYKIKKPKLSQDNPKLIGIYLEFSIIAKITKKNLTRFLESGFR